MLTFAEWRSSSWAGYAAFECRPRRSWNRVRLTCRCKLLDCVESLGAGLVMGLITRRCEPPAQPLSSEAQTDLRTRPAHFIRIHISRFWIPNRAEKGSAYVESLVIRHTHFCDITLTSKRSSAEVWNKMQTLSPSPFKSQGIHLTHRSSRTAKRIVDGEPGTASSWINSLKNPVTGDSESFVK
jgi:hypothetical protein